MTPIDRMLNEVDWKVIPISGDPHRDIPVATHEGVLKIGDIELKCYQLDNGQRVFDVDDVVRFFGVTE